MAEPAAGRSGRTRPAWRDDVPAGRVALLLALLVLLTRLPLRTRYLLNWDADQFALGLTSFDVTHHQPHPPGYIGYEALGRLLESLTHDPNQALILLSIAGEMAGVVLLFLFAREVFGTPVAIVAGLGLALAPLFWYYGEAANTYALEPACATAVAWLCWRALQGSVKAGYGAAAALALAGALRPSTMILMLPLVLWALHRGLGTAGTMACLRPLPMIAIGWLLPLLVLSGGPLAYVHASLELGGSVTSGTALWRAGVPALATNLGGILLGITWELGILCVPALYALLVAPGLDSRANPPRGWRGFGLLWAGPSLVVFSLIHIGQVAYVQVFTPFLFMEAARGILIGARVVGRSQLIPALVGASLAANVGTFALPPSLSLAGQLREHDAEVHALTQVIPTLDPRRTVLITDAYAVGSYRTAQVYLPAYHRIAISQDRQGRAGEIFGDEYVPEGFAHAQPLVAPPGVDTWVFLDRVDVRDHVVDSWLLERRRLPGTSSTLYIWHGGAPIARGSWIWLSPPPENYPDAG